jgi:nucleoside 2-deoxyribosyltransferase
MTAPIIRAVNIYLACTVRGDRGAVSVARALADALERMGHTILTRHLLDDGVDSAESALTERAVFERDLRWLDSADILIAEASGSSYGVGFEVGYVLGRSGVTDQRVLLLYDAARRSRVSRLIAGNVHPNCTTYPYRDADDLLRFVDVFLAPVPGC